VLVLALLRLLDHRGYVAARPPAAQGRYFYGDYCSGTIEFVGQWCLSAPSAGTIGNFSRSRRRNGELYATSLDGSLYRLR
jgi:hypothetical protein